jgi:hypothetical protein
LTPLAAYRVSHGAEHLARVQAEEGTVVELVKIDLLSFQVGLDEDG